METKHPVLKDKALKFFKRETKHRHKEQKPFLEVFIPSTCDCTESMILKANCIAKAMKPFSVGKVLILPNGKDICRDFQEKLQFTKWPMFLSG